jgi:hypothetical protein
MGLCCFSSLLIRFASGKFFAAEFFGSYVRLLRERGRMG